MTMTRMMTLDRPARPRGVWVWIAYTLFCLGAQAASLTLRQTTVPLAQPDLSQVLFTETNGIPKIRWEQFNEKNPTIVTQQHPAVILENNYTRVTILPKMGRIYSLIDKKTGHEQFWTNAIAKPIRAHNDTGWWMVRGGVEYTIPRGEHGVTWALPWTHEIVEDKRSKGVRMRVVDPLTRIQQTLEARLPRDAAWVESIITLENQLDEPARFAHWINPMWAPGGRGELTPNTELIVPCREMFVLERNFNEWMLGARRQEYSRNPLRFVNHWESIGDLLCEELTDNFYAAFSHDANEGVARVFDRTQTPGMDIWTWGFPPPPRRQLDYGYKPNLGYVEMWGGTARDYSDESLGILPPRAKRTWSEAMFAFSGTEGLTYADRNVTVNFVFDPANQTAWLRLHSNLARQRIEVKATAGDKTLFSTTGRFSPGETLKRDVKLTSPIQSPPMLTLRSAEWRKEIPAQAKLPLQWGHPYKNKPRSNP